MNAQDLIPDYYHTIHVENFDEILFLGKTTIEKMIQSWEQCKKEANTKYDCIEELIDIINNKKFDKLASEFENPEFPKIAILKDNRNNFPEPCDAASINRKSGSTTFHVCGWCKYTDGGLFRYNYHIETKCRFLVESELSKDEYYFNTPCFFKNINNNTLKNIQYGLNKKREEIIEKQKNIDIKIEKLSSLLKKSVQKPALSIHRPYEWFNINDPVMCFVGNWKECINQNTWAKAKVIDGYCHHDGCVSVCYDEKQHNGEYLDGYGGSFGESRPEIMHQWEFEYLLEHPDFAQMWATIPTLSNLKEYDSEIFLDALEEYKRTEREGCSDLA